jgi:hypothetical protein
MSPVHLQVYPFTYRRSKLTLPRFPTEPRSDRSYPDSDFHPWPWAFDRGVHFLAARTTLELWKSMDEDGLAQIHEINGKVKEYDRMCAFRWCASWDAVGIRF